MCAFCACSLKRPPLSRGCRSLLSLSPPSPPPFSHSPPSTGSTSPTQDSASTTTQTSFSTQARPTSSGTRPSAPVSTASCVSRPCAAWAATHRQPTRRSSRSGSAGTVDDQRGRPQDVLLRHLLPPRPRLHLRLIPLRAQGQPHHRPRNVWDHFRCVASWLRMPEVVAHAFICVFFCCLLQSLRVPLCSSSTSMSSSSSFPSAGTSSRSSGAPRSTTSSPSTRWSPGVGVGGLAILK